jgi:hypothetical protein
MTYTVMLPTSFPNQGKWVMRKLHSLYPSGDTGHTFWPDDRLAAREWRQSSGYRMPVSELKREIKRSLGFRGWVR